MPLWPVPALFSRVPEAVLVNTVPEAPLMEALSPRMLTSPVLTMLDAPFSCRLVPPATVIVPAIASVRDPSVLSEQQLGSPTSSRDPAGPDVGPVPTIWAPAYEGVATGYCGPAALAAARRPLPQTAGARDWVLRAGNRRPAQRPGRQRAGVGAPHSRRAPGRVAGCPLPRPAPAGPHRRPR